MLKLHHNIALCLMLAGSKMGRQILPIIIKRKYWKRCIFFCRRESRFSSCIFTTAELAEQWIIKYSLSRILSQYSVDEGLYDWAIEKDLRLKMYFIEYFHFETEKKDRSMWFLIDFFHLASNRYIIFDVWKKYVY